MWRHILLLILSALVFAISGRLMYSAVGPSSPWMMLLSFLCFLGLAKVAEPVYRLKMPSPLKSLRASELDGTLYRRFAVLQFGKLLRSTPLRLLNTSVYVSGHPSGLLATRQQVESAEAIHFWGALLLLPYLVYCLVEAQWIRLAGFALIQVLGNVYPILHLRLVRVRLDRVACRSSATARLAASVATDA